MKRLSFMRRPFPIGTLPGHHSIVACPMRSRPTRLPSLSAMWSNILLLPSHALLSSPTLIQTCICPPNAIGAGGDPLPHPSL